MWKAAVQQVFTMSHGYSVAGIITSPQNKPVILNIKVFIMK